MCAVIMHTLVKKNEVFVLINGWVTANYNVSRPILSTILKFVIGYVSIFYNWCPGSLRTIERKNEVSILINGWVTEIIVFHGHHFLRHLGICKPICVKLLQVMFGIIPSNLKEKRGLYLKPFSWGPQTRHTHRQTDTQTHDDSIRRNAMRCISPKNATYKL